MFTSESQGKRLEQVRDKYGLSKQEFIKVINYSHETSYNSLIKGRRALTMKVLNALSSNLPELSLDWLLTGKGDMHLSKKRQTQKTVQLMEA